MPFCCQCGGRTSDEDLYCAACGTRQASPPRAAGGISPRAASILCYIPVLGWIPAIIVLASQQFRQDTTVRFHAFQGIYLFVAYLLAHWVLGPMAGLGFLSETHRAWMAPHLIVGSLLKLLIFLTGIFMLVKTSQGQLYKLPLLGELADRSVAEQK